MDHHGIMLKQKTDRFTTRFNSCLKHSFQINDTLPILNFVPLSYNLCGEGFLVNKLTNFASLLHRDFISLIFNDKLLLFISICQRLCLPFVP